ncbi:MAG: hypothetical protein FWD61_06905 [Phycisphaerales bacterium]|nr:hypothetical protein [Phycisphaerales bacterium]
MNEYFQVAQHLSLVRRAWKRAAALAGLAIVCMESLGILSVAFLIDWVYQPMPAVRVGLLFVVVAVFAVLLLRHVVRPLLKRISDDQLAMFVEEHSDQFEGALITAAELNHGKGGGESQTPQAIVDAVMRAAIARADHANVRSLVDLRRLKKYGVAAVLLLAGYGLMCIAFPDVGRHASRVLVPWQRTREDMRRVGPNGQMLLPVEFTLSKGNSKILRRESFDLQATLSRTSNDTVLLYFRPAAQENQPWRAIPMKEIEKLNTFAGALADVDEDTEFYVSTGSDRSPVHKLAVYDPLKLLGFQITTQYPPYLQLPNRVEVAPSGELMAPVGSKITLRILANAQLTNAQLTWQNGKQQPMQIENAEKGSAVATFDVNENTTYTYTVFDGNGQKEQSPIACSVRALVDLPPTLEMTFPLATVTANPLGEVTFAAEASDDFAIAAVDLVYQRQMASGGIISATRVPLTLSRAAAPKDAPGPVFPDVAQANVRFALEDLQPPPAPEEIISYYLECTDRKGQAVRTDIQMIVVDHFDSWPQFDPKPPHGPTFTIIKNITEYLQASWKFEQQRPTMKPEEFASQTKSLAASMIDPETTQMYPFYERKKVPPEKIAHADRADQYLESGYQALLKADTAKAVADFRIVLAELTILKLDKSGVEMFAADYGKKGMPQDFEKELNKLFAQVQVEVDRVQTPPGWDPPEAKAAEKLQKAAEELSKEQDKIVKKAEEITQASGTTNKKHDGAKNQDKDKDRAREQAAKDAKALAAEQDIVAAKTQKKALTTPTEAKDKQVKTMGERLAEAAKAMRDASRNMQENKSEQALADATRAQLELRRVAERLDAARQEKVAAAVAAAENSAAKLLREQKKITQDTQATAKDAKSSETQKETNYKKLTYRQAQLQVKTDRFKKDVEELRNMAQRDAKTETVKQLNDAHREMVRGEADQKMVNAVVELKEKHADAATKEQAQAEEGLDKVLKSLRKTEESMAADRESQLARAKEEARRIDEGLTKLSEKESTTQPATEKKALADDLSYEMERLSRHLADRDFAEKPDRDYLANAAQNPTSLTDEMLSNSNKRNELATVVRRVRDKLEAEYQTTLDAKRLQDAQREDCPPNYRQMVNKYYEALAETSK